MSIKRYDYGFQDGYSADGMTGLQFDENGALVKYSDYAALEQQLAESQSKLEKLAEENAGLINSSVFTLQDGRPPYGFYASEWFIAKLKNGEYAALKALPEEYSYDYRTNDGTYYTKDWVVGWMQTPDTEYRPNVKTPATDAVLAEVRASGVEMFALMYAEEAIKSESISIGWRARASKAASEYADQLRKGVQS